MKAKFTAHRINSATVEYDDAISGKRITLTIGAGMGGGYVRDNDGQQVCKGLGNRGDTLLWNGTTPMIDVLRREYRARAGVVRHYLGA